MSWKNGDYFGSSNPPLEEQQFPVVTITSPQGTTTVFAFSSAGLYSEFLIWATWAPMSEGCTLSITKQQHPFPDDRNTDRFKLMWADFRSFQDGFNY